MYRMIRTGVCTSVSVLRACRGTWRGVSHDILPGILHSVEVVVPTIGVKFPTIRLVPFSVISHFIFSCEAADWSPAPVVSCLPRRATETSSRCVDNNASKRSYRGNNAPKCGCCLYPPCRLRCRLRCSPADAARLHDGPFDNCSSAKTHGDIIRRQTWSTPTTLLGVMEESS